MDNKIIDFNKLKNETENKNTSSNKNVNLNVDVNKDTSDANIIDLNSKENKKLKKEIVKETKQEIKKKDISKHNNLASSNSSRKSRTRKENVREVKIEIFNEDDKKTKSNIGKITFNVFLYSFVLILLIIITINLPIFKVENLIVSGNNTVSKNDVEELINLKENNNFLFLYFKDLENEILKNPMIKNVEIRRTFPNEIIVKIEEIIIAGYIPYLTEYVYIDSNGKVVQINSELIPNVPLIVGLNFTNFSLGNVLEVTNETSLDIIIELTNIINKYMTHTEIAKIDITNIEDIRIIMGKTEIILGEMENCDYKLRKAIEIIKKLPDAEGYLDVSSTSNRSVFTFK